MRCRPFLAALVFGVLLASSRAGAAEILVAVAANFAAPAAKLVETFEGWGADRVLLTLGSTGKLYAQIVHGAPYHAFLAADQVRPTRLVEEGEAVAYSRFTYAVGRLALVASPGQPASVQTLRGADLDRLAIANPKLAPYGAAAMQVLHALNVGEALQTRLVYGENIGQAYALLATGNADAGLVALAQLKTSTSDREYWLVPADLHEPIRQDAVLLARAAENELALRFHAYLQSHEARVLIRSFGYDTP